MKIPNFTNYNYIEGIVTNTKSNKVVKLTTTSRGYTCYKLKNDEGKWKQVSQTKPK